MNTLHILSTQGQFEGVRSEVIVAGERVSVRVYGEDYGMRCKDTNYLESFPRSRFEPAWSNPEIGPQRVIESYAGSIAASAYHRRATWPGTCACED